MMPEVHLALHHRHRVFQYLALYALAVSVFGVENLSKPLSLRVIVCQEEPERHFGRADPAHRVYPRAQDKTDVAARYVLPSNPDTSINALRPALPVLESRVRPCFVNILFSPTCGTMSATVPSATRSRKASRTMCVPSRRRWVNL